jgi:hypothetical protein
MDSTTAISAGARERVEITGTAWAIVTLVLAGAAAIGGWLWLAAINSANEVQRRVSIVANALSGLDLPTQTKSLAGPIALFVVAGAMTLFAALYLVVRAATKR